MDGITHASTTSVGGETEFVRESRKGNLLLTIMLCTLGLIGLMVYSSSGPPDVTLSAASLGVRSGAYGITVPRREIEEVRLLRRVSGIGRKQNAFQFGSTYAGRFEMKPHGSTLLFLDATRPPFVQLRWRGTVLIFNAQDSASTQALFDSLTHDEAGRRAR